jgi:hypothetical protein
MAAILYIPRVTSVWNIPFLGEYIPSTYPIVFSIHTLSVIVEFERGKSACLLQLKLALRLLYFNNFTINIFFKYIPFWRKTYLLHTQYLKNVCIHTKVCKYIPHLLPCIYDYIIWSLIWQNSIKKKVNTMFSYDFWQTLDERAPRLCSLHVNISGFWLFKLLFLNYFLFQCRSVILSWQK